MSLIGRETALCPFCAGKPPHCDVCSGTGRVACDLAVSGRASGPRPLLDKPLKPELRGWRLAVAVAVALLWWVAVTVRACR